MANPTYGPALLWWLSQLPEGFRYYLSLKRCQTTQSQLLIQILEKNLGCRYFQHHRLQRASLEDFRQRLPVVEYSDLEPWIEQICGGQSGVLTNEKVLLLEPTSGSSALKLIPYTQELRRQFQMGVAAWISHLFWSHSQLLKGRAYWSITPPPGQPQRTSGGLPIGFADDASYLANFAQNLVRSWLVSSKAQGPAPTAEFLAQCQDLTLVSVWSPSYWMLISQILEQQGRRPQDLWPHLTLISCWGDGPARPYRAALQDRYPMVTFQDKGLLATEGIVTLPWGQHKPLALRSHFFEFLQEDGQILLAHQLNLRRVYEVLLTTGGGFYRYRLGDLVQVDGFVGDCPSLTFLGRRGGVVDHCGEKLTPAAISPWLPQDLCQAGPCFVAFDNGSYCLYAQASPDRLQETAALGEAHLCGHYHYQLCRQLGQLGPLRYRAIGAKGWAQFYAHLSQKGQRLGDIKPTWLRPETDWSAAFDINVRP